MEYGGYHCIIHVNEICSASGQAGDRTLKWCAVSSFAAAQSKSTPFSLSLSVSISLAFSLANVHGLAKLLALGPADGIGRAALAAGRLGGRGEDVPEAKGLVGGGRNDGRSIGTAGHVKDTGGVTFEFLDLGHGGILPQTQLVAGEAVGGQQLLLVGVPLKSTNLRSGVDGVQQGTGLAVPELDASIGGTATSGEEVPLMRRPRQGLDGGLVVGEGVAGRGRGRGGGIPQAKLVVVAATGQSEAVGTPRQATYLLRMAGQSGDVVAGNADVVVDDDGVASTRGQNVAVPGQTSHALGMAVHGTELLAGLDVPQLSAAAGRADGNVSATLLDPRDGGDVGVVPTLEGAELLDIAGAGIPEVHGLVQSNGQDVGIVPRQEVEVVIVEEVGSVEDAAGRRGDLTAHELGGLALVDHGGARRGVQDLEVVDGVALGCWSLVLEA
mmetsp:Transcript_29262/g.68542  ORF Transcript_29262/g.68542 Transcript_29262/m.68542 type:complete len:440 (-) Transcript_29262:250-1569(-)